MCNHNYNQIYPFHETEYHMTHTTLEFIEVTEH